MTKSLNNSRIEWVDTAKGIAIFLVVFGHIIPDGIIHKMIYSFHMPLFFILSGLFILPDRPISLRKSFKSKLIRLYVTFLIFGYLLLIPFDYFWGTFICPSEILQDLATNQLIGQPLALRNDWTYYGNLRFLPCLLVGTMLILTIAKYQNGGGDIHK